MPRPAWYPTAARSWADARRRHSATHHPPRVNRVATLTGGPAPLSSRGLGRRPLTAETGVRIPVAVLEKPAEPLRAASPPARGSQAEESPLELAEDRHSDRPRLGLRPLPRNALGVESGPL